ncbi:hypothetical protein SAMN06264364_120100 [Quadrisphaera granulorum]|uniref:Uncharacterized protein n=1 Tax=Quadrisphaera granulorum TaxID=317664 RepID=A0A316A1U4_9ACTN|nr:HGGxSTG domain-containing protein [Quadrisphaera granulorum]PWJ51821.1 hypothetical protein BXY45_120100 [Quadrisphaera granulorum]SZE97768.1 hypothetical protein SAMN06264364_120100 [Quadrisphaera granulorum]
MREDPLHGATSSAVCGAKTRSGGTCQTAPMRGTNRCRMHGGAAPQTQKKARERLLAAADPLMAMLLKIAMSSDNEVVRLRATMDALDRAGLTERGVATAATAQPFDDLLAGIIDEAVRTEPMPEDAERQLAPAMQPPALPAAPLPTSTDTPTPGGRASAPLTVADQERVAAGAGDPTGPQRGSAYDPADTVPGEVLAERGSIDPPAWVLDRLDPPKIPPGFADISR